MGVISISVKQNILLGRHTRGGIFASHENYLIDDRTGKVRVFLRIFDRKTSDGVIYYNKVREQDFELSAEDQAELKTLIEEIRHDPNCRYQAILHEEGIDQRKYRYIDVGINGVGYQLSRGPDQYGGRLQRILRTNEMIDKTKRENTMGVTIISIRQRILLGKYGRGSIFANYASYLVDGDNVTARVRLHIYDHHEGREAIFEDRELTKDFKLSLEETGKLAELLSKIRHDKNCRYVPGRYETDRFDRRRYHYIDVMVNGTNYELARMDGGYGAMLQEILHANELVNETRHGRVVGKSEAIPEPPKEVRIQMEEEQEAEVPVSFSEHVTEKPAEEAKPAEEPQPVETQPEPATTEPAEEQKLLKQPVIEEPLKLEQPPFEQIMNMGQPAEEPLVSVTPEEPKPVEESQPAPAEPAPVTRKFVRTPITSARNASWVQPARGRR